MHVQLVCHGMTLVARSDDASVPRMSLPVRGVDVHKLLSSERSAGSVWMRYAAAVREHTYACRQEHA